MRRWYFKRYKYITDMASLYSIENNIIYCHRLSPLRGYAKDRSNYNEDVRGFMDQSFPMTLAWLINNIEFIPSHIPTATARQILEDLAHAHSI